MKTILLDEKYILEYIKDILHDYQIGRSKITDYRYHHNTSYKDAASICKYGILSMKDLNKLGIRNDSEEILIKMADTESHVNGDNGISLSVVGLQDLYKGEDEYNPYVPFLIDFLVSDDIRVCRSPIHYGNEFISYSSITRDKLRSIDIRLLKLIELTECSRHGNSTQNILEKYNNLRDIALTIKQYNLDIPLREMSYQDNKVIDLDKMARAPKLVIKK